MESKKVSFGEAIEALKQGKRVQREGWNGKGLFIFMQIPAEIDVETVVPKMQSLPQSVKDEFINRGLKTINYKNQLAVVYPDNTIYGWSPSTNDAMSNDWIIIK